MLAARYVPSSPPSLVIPGGEAQGRVHLARERCHKAVLTLIRRCYSHIRAPPRPHGRGVLRRRCAQPSAPVERDTPVPFPSPAQGRPCSCLARRRTVSHVFEAGSWVFPSRRQRVVEHEDRGLEAEAVRSKVRLALCLIPRPTQVQSHVSILRKCSYRSGTKSILV